MADRFSLDIPAIRRAFNRAAADFDAAAMVHGAVRDRALQRLRLLKASPSVVLDLGAGTGHATAWLRKHYPRAQVIAVDAAIAMLMQPPYRNGWQQVLGLRRSMRICADANTLPLRDASVDWIFSNLMLPWCDDPARVFSEMHRVLKPGGVVSFTTAGPDTLRELRQAWREVDPGGRHVHPFADMHDLGDLLLRAGFAEPVMDMEYFTVTYPDVASLKRDLAHTGSVAADRLRPRGLTGRRRYREFCAAYERQRVDDKLPVTVEIVYGHAWRGLGESTRTSSLHEARVSLAQIGRRKA